MSRPKDRENNSKDFLFMFRQSKKGRPVVIPRAEAKERVVDLKLQNYRLETAKISEAVEATIKSLQMMHQELIDSKPQQAKKYLSQSEEIQQKKQELGFDEAAAIVAAATIKRNVQDPSVMKEVQASMDKINEMVALLARIKPDIIKQDVRVKSKQSRFEMLNNITSYVGSIAQRFGDRLNRRINVQLNRANKRKGPHAD